MTMQVQPYRKTDSYTAWRVILPSGKAYIATTYPDSDHVYLETAKGRAISPVVARNLIGQIRDAIALVSA